MAGWLAGWLAGERVARTPSFPHCPLVLKSRVSRKGGSYYRACLYNVLYEKRKMALTGTLREAEFSIASHPLLSGRLRCESFCGLWLLLKAAGWVRFVPVVARWKWSFCLDERVPKDSARVGDQSADACGWWGGGGLFGSVVGMIARFEHEMGGVGGGVVLFCDVM